MKHTELPSGYEPSAVEEQWRSTWERDRTFTPQPGQTGEPFSIVIPPPNVTGVLHMGHALNLTLQDILCRHMRQLGRTVLWVPGTDHAGIATQNVVERQLAEEGLSRHDLGREAFIDRVWSWKREKGDVILNQIRKLGASVDWTREAFTFDEQRARAVREVFVTLFEQGLIYRGDYIINWCNRCHTALADDEVEHESREGRLYHIRYPLVEGGYLVVATTRPETMLGDTAVAVNPEDDRFNRFIGRRVVLPLVEKEIPVIGDTYVDMEFGTGCLKVTPAHDMNDWELGRKHGLKVLSVLDDTGRVNDNAPERYRGMGIAEARERVVEDLRALGLLESSEAHSHNVGACYRCKSTIEPHVSRQWFVAVKPLAERARAAVPDQTEIFPEQWTKVYHEWLDNIRDWCVSRQIWWGHRIPAWTCADCGELVVSREDPTLCPACGSISLAQDEDVLDTWFSSALWPFSTLGWPERTPDLKTFYPTSLLVTGFDILFFWVARMMMLGLHFMGEVPFRNVYIHALVRDEDGKKMSKSTGNVIDPLTMIERYGTDALRFTLAAFAAMGRDIRLSEARIEGYRHFMNKIWNAARFSLMHLPDEERTDPGPGHARLANRWMLHRLEEVKAEQMQSLGEYRFNESAQGLYQFVWHEFCDWYLEMIKPDLYGQDEAARAESRWCLRHILQEVLLLLHPVIPFITQEIWSHIHPEDTETIALKPFPAPQRGHIDPEAVRQAELLREAVTSVRTIRSELGISPSASLQVILRGEAKDVDALLALSDEFRHLARLSCVGGEQGPVPRATASAVVSQAEVLVPLEGLVDFGAEIRRLDKELDKLSKELEIVRKKLANEKFLANAPQDVVEKERAKLEQFMEKYATLQRLRQRLASYLDIV